MVGAWRLRQVLGQDRRLTPRVRAMVSASINAVNAVNAAVVAVAVAWFLWWSTWAIVTRFRAIRNHTFTNTDFLARQ